MTLGPTFKSLNELRVVDLKAELEKRNVDCSGVKAVLIKKLEKALKEEGEDPKTYKFSISSEGLSPKKETQFRESELNGDDKSDDEKPVSDDEGDMMPADDANMVSNDENEDNVRNELSDDEQAVLDESKMSDDEIVNPDEEVKISDDEQFIVADESKVCDDEHKSPGEYNKMSDDEQPDEDDKTYEDEKQETNESSSQEKTLIKYNEIDKKEEEGDKAKSNENNEANLSVEGENKVKEDSNEKMSDNKTDTAPPKKLRPRITAPSDDGPTTKTPVLKKDISLPVAKLKDEEFVVPEKEADIYDKDKFIVKEDVMGDCDEPMDFEAEMNNLESEDSINLTIGEEDTNFMTEEAAGLENDDKDSSEVRKADDKKRGSTQEQDSSNKHQTSSKLDGSSKAKSLWVSGLSSATRATDLKQLFNKHGKVIAAKIVTNAKTPGARCYGFVTMAAHEDAISCINALNLTELHGRLISVEPVADKATCKRTDDLKSPRSERDRVSIRSNSSRKDILSNGDRRHDRHGGRDDRRQFSRDRDRRRNDVLSFEQIKAERKKQKVLAVEREMREIDRRKRDDIMRQRDIEKRNREEAMRLERERKKLEYERERIERERAELLLLERARLEREKEELKKQKLRLEEDRRLKRPLADREEYSRSKRSTPDYGRSYSSSRHHSSRSSPSRHYDRYDRSSSSSKKDERREHGRSRSPRRKSRDRSSSSKRIKNDGQGGDDSKKCYYCGLSSHSRWDCPASNVQCPICGKTGHFGSMCSVLGYKYPAPVYFDGYKAGTCEKWPQNVDSRVKVSESSSSWSGSRPSGMIHGTTSSDRYFIVPQPPPVSVEFSPRQTNTRLPTVSHPSTPPRPPYSPIRPSSHKNH